MGPYQQSQGSLRLGKNTSTQAAGSNIQFPHLHFSMVCRHNVIIFYSAVNAIYLELTSSALNM